MKRFISYLCFLIFGLALISCDLLETDRASDIEQFSPPAPATAAQAAAPAVQTNTVMRLEPATRQLNVGDTQAVEVRIDNVTNLFTLSFRLQFNPAVLQVQDIDPNREGVQIQPGNFPAPDFVASNVVTNTTGVVQYAVTQLPPTQPLSGSGLIATILFQAINQGSSDLIFVEAIPVNNLVQPIPVTSQVGQIIVGQGTAQPPAITPTPTATLIPGQPTLTPTLLPTPTPTFTLVPPTATLTPTLPPPTSTPLPPQVVIPPGATVGFCYRVQPGESVYSLGQKFGIEPGFINLVNDLHPAGHIYPHKILFIPTQYGTGPNVYMVQPNDTLALIAEQCQLDVEVLAFVNKLTPDANLAQIPLLIIPRPPFAPPSRYPYPQVGPPSVWPPPCSAPCY